MKFSSTDFRTLRRAADVADAQRELVELAKRRSNKTPERQNWATDRAMIAAFAVIAVILSMLTLTSLA